MGASLVAQLVKNLPAMQETPVQFLVREDPLEKEQATHSSILGLPCDSDNKQSTCNTGDLGSTPQLERSPEGGHGNPLQYSGLENSMDRGAWQTTIHGVEENWTRLSDSHFLFMERHTTPHQAVHAPPK